MTSVVVITPTIGSPHLKQCVESVEKQTYPTRHQIVIDGHYHYNNVARILDKMGWEDNVTSLSQNVGANGWYGHRIYAAFSYLVNEDYIIYLDEDNWLEPNHVESLIKTIKNTNKNGNLLWAHSLRNIYSKEGEFICRDDCENLGWWPSVAGYNHVDTSCYCVNRKLAIECSNYWYGQWGADRQFFNALWNKVGWTTSGKYTLNYRLDGNPRSPTKKFFINGNKIMKESYAKINMSEFPWEKEGNGKN